MRKLLVLFFVLVAAAGFGQELTGVQWVQLSKGAKTAYLVGFIDGANQQQRVDALIVNGTTANNSAEAPVLPSLDASVSSLLANIDAYYSVEGLRDQKCRTVILSFVTGMDLDTPHPLSP